MSLPPPLRSAAVLRVTMLCLLLCAFGELFTAGQTALCSQEPAAGLSERASVFRIQSIPLSGRDEIFPDIQGQRNEIIAN